MLIGFDELIVLEERIRIYIYFFFRRQLVKWKWAGHIIREDHNLWANTVIM